VDIILSGRNAVFMQLVNSLLQYPNASLSSVVMSLYKQQSNLLHTTAGDCMSNKGAAWKSQYIVRIPAVRQGDTQKSIRTGSDVLSTAMRYIYYGSTDLLH